MTEGGRAIHLTDEILAVIPTDPYEQLDLARKITSLAIDSRVSKLESEAILLRRQISDKDRVAGELQDKLSRLEQVLQETDFRLKIALEENSKLLKERDSLALTSTKSTQDLAKNPTSDEHSPNVESMRDNIDSATSLLVPFTDLIQEKPIDTEIVPSTEVLDVTDTFTTDMVFNSRDEVIKWSRDTGKAVGTVVVIKRSDYGVNSKAPRLTFGCERGGHYREKQRGKNVKESSRRTGSKRCGCPFLLRAIKMPIEDQWMVKVECGTHNHLATQYFEGHSSAGRLTSAEKIILQELSISGVKPKDVLKVIKQRDVNNTSTMNTIYNARAKMRVSKKARRSQKLQLVHKLGEHIPETT